ncbi:MAG TPA: dihydroxyacetone kinase phosphoryl donor subunit DhaM [Bacillales bacterium]|nr:dihydroxyacetone kinase phosphoryl donor subunit DhaM [Bacillales bacterium]
MSVGVVVVSHSQSLANGLVELISQANPEVRVASAGGTDDGDLGTSAMKIKEQIESIHTSDGVVVLFDIGSAKMNADLALELLGSPENVVIADAPFVEGAYVAVVEAGMGKSVQEVQEAAEKTRLTKKINP